MQLNNEEKRYTFNEYLKLISHIADRQYQRRIWIKGEGPECQAFDAAVCDFFDVGDPILEEYKEFGISEEQYNLLKAFRNEFKKFSSIHDLPQVFIESPKWKELMEMANSMELVAGIAKELILLDPHPDAPLFDHSFQSPTFQERIAFHLDEYMRQYGDIK